MGRRRVLGRASSRRFSKEERRWRLLSSPLLSLSHTAGRERRERRERQEDGEMNERRLGSCTARLLKGTPTRKREKEEASAAGGPTGIGGRGAAWRQTSFRTAIE